MRASYTVLPREMAGTVDARTEREAKEWIEEMTGIPFPAPTFADSLKDGTILCKCVVGDGGILSHMRIASIPPLFLSAFPCQARE